jgi:DNA excision repair protein ERCC-3
MPSVRNCTRPSRKVIAGFWLSARWPISLPDASVAIQVSGTFGSRSEEAQRLGRILRPKNRSSFFYSVVTRYSNEEEFASNRQKFLAEQGYSYEIEVWTN